MARYLSDIVEEEIVKCNVCRKQFIVDELTLDDWNFTWDGNVNSDCCSDCAETNLFDQLEKALDFKNRKEEV